MFSDGYADQIGGPDNKRFRYRPFKELLLSSCTIPLLDQKKLLIETHAQWQDDNYQIDDVMVLGFEIN